MKIKIPEQIRVGAYDYRIRYVPKLVYDYKLLGQSLADSQLIKVEPDTTTQTKNVTLFHETVHAISDVYNCKIDENDIDRIAQALVAILRNDFNIEFDWQAIKDKGE